jgi:hypothetical protein
MKHLLVLAVILLVGCTDAPSNVLTYEQLVDFPVDCSKSSSQLKQLKAIQNIKHFPEDPDDIVNELDRAYNSRLKATIWWFTYRCEQ